jgi:hypothetical protein
MLSSRPLFFMKTLFTNDLGNRVLLSATKIDYLTTMAFFNNAILSCFKFSNTSRP